MIIQQHTSAGELTLLRRDHAEVTAAYAYTVEVEITGLNVDGELVQIVLTVPRDSLAEWLATPASNRESAV